MSPQHFFLSEDSDLEIEKSTIVNDSNKQNTTDAQEPPCLTTAVTTPHSSFNNARDASAPPEAAVFPNTVANELTTNNNEEASKSVAACAIDRKRERKTLSSKDAMLISFTLHNIGISGGVLVIFGIVFLILIEQGVLASVYDLKYVGLYGILMAQYALYIALGLAMMTVLVLDKYCHAPTFRDKKVNRVSPMDQDLESQKSETSDKERKAAMPWDKIYWSSFLLCFSVLLIIATIALTIASMVKSQQHNVSQAIFTTDILILIVR
eukprot:Awhi_evm1s9876